VEPVVIGLTGGIACGKSTVARTLKSKDAIIIDADRESKQLMKAGSPIWTKLIAEFGREILNPDNTINRRRLGNMVFGDGYKLKKLNSIVHPGVIEQIAGKIRRYKEEGRWPAIVLDAPLLYEVGAEKLVDFTWVVAVDRQTQINRLLARDKITPEQASQRIEAQMPLEEKVARADAVINNTGSRRATREMVYDLWNQYVERG
jgi:dephospho-CoA kinase